MKPIKIDAASLKLLEPSRRGSKCKDCAEDQALWESGIDYGITVCSLCVLYRTQWGRIWREEFVQLISEVEAKRSIVFQKTPEGRLSLCRDADSIVGGVVTANTFIAYKHALNKVQEG
jgi:hypothetical protein